MPFKKFQGYNVMVHGAPNTFTLIDKAEHARRRRLLGPAFASTAFVAHEKAILGRIDTFCQALLRETLSEAPPNLSEWCLCVRPHA
jgi:cytochrome P450